MTAIALRFDISQKSNRQRLTQEALAVLACRLRSLTALYLSLIQNSLVCNPQRRRLDTAIDNQIPKGLVSYFLLITSPSKTAGYSLLIIFS